MQLNKKQIIFISTLLFFSIFSFGIFSQTKKDALKLYRNGDYAEAIKVCQEEITEKPNNMDSYVVLCWSLVRNKQYSEAELWAIKGREISSYDQRIIEILGEAKYYLGKNSEALSLFQEYISLVPANGSRVGAAYYFMAEIYVRLGKFNHADIAFSQAVKTEPLNDAWWTRLGYVREMTKNYKLSVVAYEKAISLNNLNTEAKRGKERVMKNIR